MIATVRLGEADRDRLGAPEAMVWDYRRMLAVEAGVIQRKTRRDARAVIRGLVSGLELADADGATVTVPDVDSVVAVVWMCLRRELGPNRITWEQASEIDWYALRIDYAPEAQEHPDTAPDEASDAEPSEVDLGKDRPGASGS